MIRGLDPVAILSLLSGATLGGWNPAENGNFHLYTLVLASQTLHATGYAMGIQFDGTSARATPSATCRVLVYYGDGSTSQGDANEALVFASSYQTPQVFFLQNNQWAISVPCRASRAARSAARRRIRHARHAHRRQRRARRATPSPGSRSRRRAPARARASSRP